MNNSLDKMSTKWVEEARITWDSLEVELIWPRQPTLDQMSNLIFNALGGEIDTWPDHQ